MSWPGAMARKRSGILLMLVLCLGLATAQAGRVYESQLLSCPLIWQYDQRYQTESYRYQGSRFSSEGCGPASVANGLACVLGVESQTDMDAILRESMTVLTYNRHPENTVADLRNMHRLGNLKDEDAPVLSHFLGRFGEHLVCLGEEMEAGELLEAAGNITESGEAGLILCRFRLSEGWETLVRLCTVLRDQGYPDAVVSVSHVSVGTRAVQAPFRYRNGHYVAFCLHAGTLLERGTVYLLDSYPRALTGETVDNRVYTDRYELMVTPEESLLSTFSLRHLKPTLLRVEIEERRWGMWMGLEEKERLSALSSALMKIRTFGSGLLAVMIPESL